MLGWLVSILLHSFAPPQGTEEWHRLPKTSMDSIEPYPKSPNPRCPREGATMVRNRGTIRCRLLNPCAHAGVCVCVCVCVCLPVCVYVCVCVCVCVSCVSVCVCVCLCFLCFCVCLCVCVCVCLCV